MATDRQATSIQRALTLLAALGRSGSDQGLRYSQLRETLQCPDPSLSRLLHSLSQLNLIELGADGYRRTAVAQRLGQAIHGSNSPSTDIRQLLAQLSDAWDCGAALFVAEPRGVRCLFRHQRPGAVAFIEEGQIRQQLHGHGCAVMACAWQTAARKAHGRQLRSDLGLDGPTWQTLLADIRRRGWYAPLGSETARNQPTFMRLSLPILHDGQCLAVLCGIAHGLRREDVFPDSAIHHGQAIAERMAPLLHELLTSNEYDSKATMD